MASPEFEMPRPQPARRGQAGLRARLPRARGPDAAGADAPADAPADAVPGARGQPRPRRRFRWQHIAAAVLVGGILGASVPAGFGLTGSASADDRAASLEALASAYLEAISIGDADRATAMVPLGTGVAVAGDAALASASRLEPVEAGPARVDGDRGSVDVRYRVGGAELQRTLQAALTPAGWRLATSLAESADTSGNDPGAVLRVGGVELLDRTALRLYPAVYRVDVVEGPLFAWSGEPFTVDGDPATPTAVRAERRLMPSFADHLEALGLAEIDACRAQVDCVIRTGFRFELAAEPFVVQAFDRGRTIDLNVPLVARDPFGGETRDVGVRVTLDNRGLPVGWHCSPLGGGALVPCEE